VDVAARLWSRRCLAVDAFHSPLVPAVALAPFLVHLHLLGRFAVVVVVPLDAGRAAECSVKV